MEVVPRTEIVVTFAKPWEKNAGPDPVVLDAREAAAHKPWEVHVPKPPPAVVDDHNSRMMARGDGRVIDKIKAQAFAKAYLVDFDAARAVIRIGLADEATDPTKLVRMGNDFTRNPLVLQALQAYISRIESDKIVSRERVLMGLLTEANYYGLGGSASARVAAWGKLAKILGMELPPEDPKAARGGVMLVPYMEGGIDAWEAAAVGQQARLKADVRT